MPPNPRRSLRETMYEATSIPDHDGLHLIASRDSDSLQRARLRYAHTDGRLLHTIFAIPVA